MGTEVINIPIDKQSDSAVISTENGTSNQVHGLHSKSPSVDESGGARKDLWGPRIFGKASETKESKEWKESKESDVKECILTSPVEVFPAHQDALIAKDLNPKGQDPTNYEESDSPIKSVHRSDTTVRTHHTASHPFPPATERRASAGYQPSAASASNGNKPAKMKIIQVTDTPKKSKSLQGIPNHKVRKPLQSDNGTNTDEDPCSPVSIAASLRSHKARTTLATAPVFKCGERAVKRKEFYAKLEQKQKALEAEKMQSEARSKDEMEAALKEYRKNLIYKATPMPSFYQEGPPPKIELKKTPPTRAKSPKLGRRKSCDDSNNGDNNNGICYRLRRHSLGSYKDDCNRLQNNPKIGNAASKDKGKLLPIPLM
ncbi:uncharacterized protein A4U43_C07F25720 [Asparagus officinalis]|uniref:TPX2 C-terminal domain-containing protein n=1 Tax=Asparagus officinalis TaxID=4686 RepID=A0A5P1EIA7_ASPOF|nr:uncharacterized protein A4U43_C07F25720 [Asparagus officinalis]